MKREYKLVLIGDGGVGKTTFIKRHTTGNFETNYVPTLGCENNTITFETNHGTYSFRVWDTAGQEKFRGLGDGYYLKADCAIIMFDVTSEGSFENVAKWERELKRVAKVPSILVANKVDLLSKELPFLNELSQKVYYDVSVKSDYGTKKPFLYLLKKLTGKQDIIILRTTC